MNTLSQESSFTPVDYHAHRCTCGCVFTHHKSLIAHGMGAYAHVCPSCDHPVNDRIEIDEIPATGVDFRDWYGVRGLGLLADLRPSNTDLGNEFKE